MPVLARRKVVGIITRTALFRTLHHDLLAAARAKPKSPVGLESLSRLRRREGGGVLRDRLPSAVLDLLRTTGELAERLGYSAYVVGGFVRDLLLGIDNLDVDVAVEGDGIASRARPRQGQGGPRYRARSFWYGGGALFGRVQAGRGDGSHGMLQSTRPPCRRSSGVPSRRISTAVILLSIHSRSGSILAFSPS